MLLIEMIKSRSPDKAEPPWWGGQKSGLRGRRRPSCPRINVAKLNSLFSKEAPMKNNKINNSFQLIPILAFSILFSCASTQEMQVESRDTEAHAYNHRAIEYLKRGQYDNAISDLNKALEINPRYDEAYYNRGNAYFSKNQHDRAIADYSNALDINPRYAKAYYDRGVAYYFKGEYEKSWADIRRAQNLAYQIPPQFLERLYKDSNRQN
jgi:tetratricopeptide (TPR) repeat protein